MKKPSNKTSKLPDKGDEHLHRLLGRTAAPLPVVPEPDPLPVEDVPQPSRLQQGADAILNLRRARQGLEPVPPGEIDWFAGVKARWGLTDEEIEEHARDMGF
jgi:hypothetical protein